MKRLQCVGYIVRKADPPSERKYWKELSEEEIPQEKLQSDGGGTKT
jgi:hypothetical protein